jgi:DNA-binding transcriptional ArsR family regulator
MMHEMNQEKLMDEQSRLVEVIAALADPLRLALLQALMAGPATVSELVAQTGASQPNVSNHLALLRERGLVRASRQGRQSIYVLRDATVAQLVESLAVLAGTLADGEPDESVAALARAHRVPAGVASARTCYDHLAGRLGVGLFDALVARGAIVPPREPGEPVALGLQAREVFGGLGLDLGELRRARRRFATGCLDWTERRPHLGGALGAAVWAQCGERGWVARVPGGRAIRVTDAGKRGFEQWLGLVVDTERGWEAGHA